MNQVRIALSLLLVSAGARAAEPVAFALFDGEGRPVTYSAMLERLAAADVVLFGELHNNAPAHWLQRRVTAGLFAARGPRLVLGAEMYERDNQLLLDEFLAGRIREKDLTDEAKLWPNHATDYLPLLTFAAEHKLAFLATNVPRRYAALVARSGLAALDGLAAEARALLAPLPIAVDLSLPGYAAMLQMGGHGGPSPEQLVHAQALKDATMADTILRGWAPGRLVLHFNGAYHSNRHEGIAWYLRQARPELTIAVISTVEQDDIAALAEESHGLGDFVIATPSDFTKTY